MITRYNLDILVVQGNRGSQGRSGHQVPRVPLGSPVTVACRATRVLQGNLVVMGSRAIRAKPDPPDCQARRDSLDLQANAT